MRASPRFAGRPPAHRHGGQTTCRWCGASLSPSTLDEAGRPTADVGHDRRCYKRWCTDRLVDALGLAARKVRPLWTDRRRARVGRDVLSFFAKHRKNFVNAAAVLRRNRYLRLAAGLLHRVSMGLRALEGLNADKGSVGRALACAVGELRWDLVSAGEVQAP